MQVTINVSVSDKVSICFALFQVIRRYFEFYKDAVEINGDSSFYLDEILSFVHAYESVSLTPFSCDDDALMSLISSNIK